MFADQPTTKKQARSFLGLVGWYRRFIPNFSEKAAPLTELTRKNQPHKVEWTNGCETAFKTLKDSLCQEPVLLSLDFEKPFTVQTDVSERGLGQSCCKMTMDSYDQWLTLATNSCHRSAITLQWRKDV